MGLLQRSIIIGLILKAVSFMKVRVLDLVAARYSITAAITRKPHLVLSLEVFPDSGRHQHPKIG